MDYNNVTISMTCYSGTDTTTTTTTSYVTIPSYYQLFCNK